MRSPRSAMICRSSPKSPRGSVRPSTLRPLGSNGPTPIPEKSAKLAMKDAPDGRKTAAIPALSGSTTYRVVAGSAESKPYSATAVEPPRIASFSVKVVPPAYTSRPSFEAADPSRVEAFERSKVELKVVSKTRSKVVEVRWPKPGGTEKEFERALFPASSDGLGATFFMLAEASGPFLDPPSRCSRDPEPNRRSSQNQGRRRRLADRRPVRRRRPR